VFVVVDIDAGVGGVVMPKLVEVTGVVVFVVTAHVSGKTQGLNTLAAAGVYEAV